VQSGSNRQIELIDLKTRKRTALTQGADHFNPSLSPDGRWVVSHKASPGHAIPNVELWGTPPGTNLKLLRLAGAFPAFSPDGKRPALPGPASPPLAARTPAGPAPNPPPPATNRGLFSTSWSHHGDRIAFAVGPVFKGPEVGVSILSIRPDGSDSRKL